MASIIDIKNIGYAYKEKLARVGIRTTESLIERTATPGDRLYIEELTSISNRMLFKWAKLSELLKIKGITHGYFVLLETIGIDSKQKLLQQDPFMLKKKLLHANKKHRFVDKDPSFYMIIDWIEQARELPENVF